MINIFLPYKKIKKLNIHTNIKYINIEYYLHIKLIKLILNNMIYFLKEKI